MKSKFMHFFVTAAGFLAFTLFGTATANAATCTWTGATDTDWHAATNWSGCGGLEPQTVDNVVIANVVNAPTLTLARTIHNLTVNSSETLTLSAILTMDGTSLATTLINSGTITGAGILHIQGNASVANGNCGVFSASLEIAAGIMDVDSCTIVGNIVVQSGGTLRMGNTPSLGMHANGDLTIDAGGALTHASTNAIFTFGGVNFINNGTVTVIRFTFNRAGAQNWSGTGSFAPSTVNNLGSIASGSTTTLASNVNISNSNFTIANGATLALGGFQLTLNGVIFACSGTGNVTGTALGKLRTQGATTLQSVTIGAPVEVNSGTTSVEGGCDFNALVTIVSTMTVGNNAVFNANNDLTIDPTGSIAGGSTNAVFNFDGANFVNNGSVTVRNVRFLNGSHSLSGTGGFSSNTISTIFNGSVVTLASDHLMNRVIIDGGGTFNISNRKLSVTGNPSLGVVTITNNGTFTTTGSTVNYAGGTTDISISGITYHSLMISNPVGVLLGAGASINGDLTINPGGIFNINFGTPLALKGNWTNNGTFNAQAGYAGLMTFNGTTAQTIGGSNVTDFYNFTLNNANGISLNSNARILNVFTLTNGIVTTGANTLMLGAAATRSRTSGHVFGNLQKTFSAIGSFVFDVGTAGLSNYSPATINVDSATSFPADFTVKATPGILAGTAQFSTLQRYWTLTPGAGITQADITFQYVQADVPPQATESQFVFTRRTGGSNQSFTPSSFNTTTNIFTLNNQTTFSDWTLEDLAPTAASVLLGGRIMSANGSGVSKARVTLIESDGTTRVRLTNPFGYYRFEDVSVGQTVVISVDSKLFTFETNSMVINVTETMENLNFIAEP